jgi:hypothetical protein
MTAAPQAVFHTGSANGDYRRLSLVALIARIAQASDPAALNEFHNQRTPFTWRNGQPLRFIEYVGKLRELRLARQWCGHDPLVIEQAHDLTVGRFTNLPRALALSGQSPSVVKQDGPDCRCYYMAYLRHIRKKLKVQPAMDELQREHLAAHCLQVLVMRHFYFSCMECRRRLPSPVTRYLWSASSAAMCLCMPAEMSGRRRRAWLEANVPEIDARRPGERQRVQQIIDRLLIRRQVLPLSLNAQPVDATGSNPAAVIGQDSDCVDLAAAVAQEKAANILLQRPAIQSLGRQRLKALIRRIFEDLAAGSYQDGQVAQSFGLSRASFSRFAGSQWARQPRSGDAPQIPDL